jgi:hypothetical protein
MQIACDRGTCTLIHIHTPYTQIRRYTNTYTHIHTNTYADTYTDSRGGQY